MPEHLSVERELKAYQALTDVLTRAREAQLLFEDADLPIPPALLRLLGEVKETSDDEPKLIVTRPKPPPRPSGAQENWIHIDVKSLTPTSLVLGLLRSESGRVKSRLLFDKLSKFQPDANMGSMLNIGARLDPDLIDRAEDGWSLKDPSQAPVLHEGYAWGPATVFMKQEVAEHRRVIILHILSAAKGGMQIVQVTNQLKNCGYCHAPATKDLVKTDMEVLEEEGRVRRIGNSRKWTLAARAGKEPKQARQ